MVGFTEFGLKSCDDMQLRDESDEIATEVLVILVVGLLGHWKAPVAYLLTSMLSAAVQGQPIKKAIMEVETVSLSVVASVMNGFAANVKMVKDFGCRPDMNNMSPFFPNPTDRQNK